MPLTTSNGQVPRGEDREEPLVQAAASFARPPIELAAVMAVLAGCELQVATCSQSHDQITFM